MRTPGDARELAAGFHVTEGLVKRVADIFDITPCIETPDGTSKGNIIDIALADPRGFDLEKLTRHVFTASNCGICGKTSIATVRQQFAAVHDDPLIVSAEGLLKLPGRMAAAQSTFHQTGGLHGSAVFDADLNLLAVREDLSRHNALDKLVGWALLNNLLPLRGHVLLLSGSVPFEMMQKALAARIPLVAAISAPSSLAVEFAREGGQTLVGFLRGETMNIYADAARAG
jgi:FdhD protein